MKLSATPRKQSTNAKRNSRRNSKHKLELNCYHLTPHTTLIAQLITARSLDTKTHITTVLTAKHIRIQPKPKANKQLNFTLQDPYTLPHNTTSQCLTGNKLEQIIPTTSNKKPSITTSHPPIQSK